MINFKHVIFKKIKLKEDIPERYRKYIGKPIVSRNGTLIGTIRSIKINKKDGSIISIEFIDLDGNIKQLNPNQEKVEFLDGKVILHSNTIEYEYMTIIKNLKTEVSNIKQKLRELNDKLMKLSDLLIQGTIDSTTFNEVKSRIDKDRNQLIQICREKVSKIDEIIQEFEKKCNEFERRRGELLVKKVLENLSDEEEKELTFVENTVEKIRRIRYELSLLKMELETECFS